MLSKYLARHVAIQSSSFNYICKPCFQRIIQEQRRYVHESLQTGKQNIEQSKLVPAEKAPDYQVDIGRADRGEANNHDTEAGGDIYSSSLQGSQHRDKNSAALALSTIAAAEPGSQNQSDGPCENGLGGRVEGENQKDSGSEKSSGNLATKKVDEESQSRNRRSKRPANATKLPPIKEWHQMLDEYLALKQDKSKQQALGLAFEPAVRMGDLEKCLLKCRNIAKVRKFYKLSKRIGHVLDPIDSSGEAKKNTSTTDGNDKSKSEIAKGTFRWPAVSLKELEAMPTTSIPGTRWRRRLYNAYKNAENNNGEGDASDIYITTLREKFKHFSELAYKENKHDIVLTIFKYTDVQPAAGLENSRLFAAEKGMKIVKNQKCKIPRPQKTAVKPENLQEIDEKALRESSVSPEFRIGGSESASSKTDPYEGPLAISEKSMSEQQEEIQSSVLSSIKATSHDAHDNAVSPSDSDISQELLSSTQEPKSSFNMRAKQRAAEFRKSKLAARSRQSKGFSKHSKKAGKSLSQSKRGFRKAGVRRVACGDGSMPNAHKAVPNSTAQSPNAVKTLSSGSNKPTKAKRPKAKKVSGVANCVTKRVDASTLHLTPVDKAQKPVPELAYGLDRVLFNPGVYHLQDPRSRVFNFDPYVGEIMPVDEFDFNALKEYITSSRDTTLLEVASEVQKKYTGSTSSMTSALSHFHFLLSQWRLINPGKLTRDMPVDLYSFSTLR